MQLKAFYVDEMTIFAANDATTQRSCTCSMSATRAKHLITRTNLVTTN